MKNSLKKIFSAIIGRITLNPITTILGVILTSLGTWSYFEGNHETGMLMIGAGIGLITNKDN